MRLGSLQLFPIKEKIDLVADPVARAIERLPVAAISVATIDPAFSDTASFCANYGVGMDQSANCIVLKATRGDRSWFAACVVLATTRADINGIVRKTLDARKVSFAPMEEAVAQSGMEFGAITPIGLPADWSVLVDKAVADSDYVIIGSGVRASKLAVPGSLFASLPNAQIIEGLGRSIS